MSNSSKGYRSHLHGKVDRFVIHMNRNSRHRIVIPQRFMDHFAGEISETIKLEVPNGNVYDVRVTEQRNRTVLLSGWEAFVDANHIVENDSVLFQYRGSSCFEVVLFDSSGCEKAVSCALEEESVSVQETSTNFTEISSSDYHTELSTSEGSDACENRISVRRRKRRKTSVISFASEGPGEDGPLECESLELDDVQITPGTEYVLLQRSSLAEALEERVLALIQEIKPKTTVFVAVMLKTHVEPPNPYLSIPKKYAVVHFPDESATVTLQSPGKRKKWHPKFYRRGTMMKLTGNWAGFVRDNNVHEGDICIFVPAKGGTSFTFTVHLIRDGTTDSQIGGVPHESRKCDNSHSSSKPSYIIPYGTRLSPPQKEAVEEKVHSLQSEVPIYVAIMTKSALGSRHMELSSRYAAAHLPHRNQPVIFQCEGKIWNINLLFHDKSVKRWYFIGGWSKFIDDNGLKLEDICLFELKKNEEMLTMVVHLKRKFILVPYPEHPRETENRATVEEAADEEETYSHEEQGFSGARTKMALTERVREEQADEAETSSPEHEEQGFSGTSPKMALTVHVKEEQADEEETFSPEHEEQEFSGTSAKMVLTVPVKEEHAGEAETSAEHEEQGFSGTSTKMALTVGVKEEQANEEETSSPEHEEQGFSGTSAEMALTVRVKEEQADEAETSSPEHEEQGFSGTSTKMASTMHVKEEQADANKPPLQNMKSMDAVTSLPGVSEGAN